MPILGLSMGLMMVRLFAMAHLLGVASFAEFSEGILISSTFCMLGCLGLQSMLQREWPVNILRRQENRGLVLAAQCNVVAIACAVAGLALASLGLSSGGTTAALLAMGLLHGLSQQMFLIASTESRSRGATMAFARQNLVRALGCLFAGATAAVLTQSALLTLATEAVLSIAWSVVLLRQSTHRTALRFFDAYRLAVRRLPRLNWRSAMTLMAITGIGFLLLNADRWVAADRLSKSEFAHYSFAWILLIVAQSLQALVNASIYPLLARRSATFGNRAAFRICAAAAALVLAAGACCFAPAWLLANFGIRRWFPLYADAIALLPVFFVIGMLRASDFWTSYLLIVGRESALLMLNVAAGIASVIVWSLIVHPWLLPVTPSQIALLALLLTVLSYAAAAALAWTARRP